MLKLKEISLILSLSGILILLFISQNRNIEHIEGHAINFTNKGNSLIINLRSAENGIIETLHCMDCEFLPNIEGKYLLIEAHYENDKKIIDKMEILDD